MAQTDQLSATDRRLVEVLQRDGRRPYAELGSDVGMSGPSAHERVKKLEARGVITGYAAVVDPAAGVVRRWTPAQPTVAFEATPETGGECCRDPIDPRAPAIVTRTLHGFQCILRSALIASFTSLVGCKPIRAAARPRRTRACGGLVTLFGHVLPSSKSGAMSPGGGDPYEKTES
jgi:DNA-binding Lrp family transcriptional regulator